MIRLDFRSKLTVFLSTVFLASILSKDTVFFLLTAILLLYLFVSGYGKFTKKITIAIFLVAVLRVLSRGNGFGILLPEMFLFIILRTLVIILSVIPIIKTPPGELMAVMKKLKVHRNISLPLIFMMRFLPVIKSEFSEIIDSLKLRGMISIKKPFTTMEYLFVPMMFSASKIAEELAAASEVRGISSKGVQTSRREIKFRRKDFIVLFLTIFLTIGLYYMERVVII
ncbi:MAG: energy-coupling factor transporter transmembrane component T [Peptostreptococcus sp.]|uniref:energy-coupling factor transporter transmembrane component T family protein n=1 Tax=Peptostreptococcus sp. TaxID=1262 RepID=UPI002FCA31F9